MAANATLEMLMREQARTRGRMLDMERRIGEMMDEKIAASEERLYRRIKDGALSEINERLDSMAGDIGILKSDFRSMGEDLAKLTDLPDQLSEVNRRLDAIETNAGMR